MIKYIFHNVFLKTWRCFFIFCTNFLVVLQEKITRIYAGFS